VQRRWIEEKCMFEEMQPGRATKHGIRLFYISQIKQDIMFYFMYNTLWYKIYTEDRRFGIGTGSGGRS
jgi:hypothetical protein